ncbi:heterokaryon incompatibility protein-domain-containing protein, partial [Fusarium flagelliforme]|uniref:heterokaryon incompatibility protein-domain-containing protein n=1 Tax=Fusarium flagelliforme TaxID=2675880 RepID=UPI001E8EC092
FQSVTSQEMYNYQALPSQAHIRLVRLRGLLFWQRIQILSYPLDACPAFEAISYTWDGQAATTCVIINGRRLLITRNAQQILHGFTPACGERMIWIDSICINQSQDVNSLAEKKAQIGRMSEIYRRATRVRVWLSRSSVLETQLPEFLHLVPQERNATIEHAILRLFLRFAGPPSPSSRSLELLLSHNYWSRVWIVQEIAFGQEVIIHLGSTCVTWESVPSFATSLLPTNEDEEKLGPIIRLGRNIFYDIPLSGRVIRGIRQVCLITSLRSKLTNEAPRELLSLLELLIGTQAFDPRDKIYGAFRQLFHNKMHTLADQDTNRGIRADYKVSARILYTNLALSYLTIDGERDARILLYAGMGWPRRVGNLPSWVPDWTSIPETHLRGMTSKLFHRSIGLGEPECEDTFSVAGNVLKISGCRVIDVISAQTRIIDHNDTSRQWFHEVCDVVGGQLRVMSKEETDISGGLSRCYRRCPGRWRGAIFRVLIGDITSYW